MSELSLTADGERVLKEAENACWRLNVAIIAPEHLLGAALLSLLQARAMEGLQVEAIEGAMRLSQGLGSEALDANVMFGSGARAAINFTAARVRSEGGTRIDSRALALGTIESGEVSPMFYGSLGVTREALLELVANSRPQHE